MKLVPSHLRLPLVALLVTGALASAAGVTYAAFSSSTSSPPASFQTKRMFPAERINTAWRIEDAADNSAADRPYELAFEDNVTLTTTNWANAWAANRYVQFELNSSLPAGLSLSSPVLELTFKDNDVAAGNQFCFYFEVRKTSDASVLSTHGSSGSPVGCEAAGVMTTFTTALPALTSSDLANDVTIRVFGSHSGGARAIVVDRVSLRSLVYSGSKLYPVNFVDSADTTPATTYWGPAKLDGNTFQSGAWATAYGAGRYLRFWFPPYVPATAAVTSAALEYSYRSGTAGQNSCFYFEVYAGTTLIGTHGNATGSDVDCNNTGSIETISTALAEVDTAAEARDLSVKLFTKNSGNSFTLTDGARLKLTYSLDQGAACVDSSFTLVPTADSWVQEDSNTSNFGTGLTNLIQARTTGRNRRILVGFDLPAVSGACTLQAATLRMRLNATGGARTLNVFGNAAAWTETAVTWATQPGSSGSAVSTTTGGAGTWTQWNVLAHVQAMYSGANHGFSVRDSAEGVGNVTQTYDAKESSNDPELVLSFG